MTKENHPDGDSQVFYSYEWPVGENEWDHRELLFDFGLVAHQPAILWGPNCCPEDGGYSEHQGVWLEIYTTPAGTPCPECSIPMIEHQMKSLLCADGCGHTVTRSTDLIPLDFDDVGLSTGKPDDVMLIIRFPEGSGVPTYKMSRDTWDRIVDDSMDSNNWPGYTEDDCDDRDDW